jgi:proton-translocating NADH-quinone oxidoreductase chain N
MVNPVVLIAVPLGLAFALPLFGLISKRIVKFIPVFALLFNLIVALMLIPGILKRSIIVHIGGFPPPFCINLVAGPVGVLFSALIALAGLLVAIYALVYIKEGPEEKYHILYLLLLTGATGVVLTGDIFNLFVFFEILCISSYALVAYFGDRGGIESAVKYLIQGSIGSSFLLIGIGLLYGLFGTLNMADLARQIQSVNSTTIFIPMVFMITGLGIEAAIFPLNAWLPDAHSSAPSSISAILSGIAIEVGLYAVVRILFTLFVVSGFFTFLLFLGVLTLLIGEMCAFGQNNIKRMLAYSSIGQIGLIVFAMSIATSSAVTGGLFQMVSHTLGKGLLFLAAGYMIVRSGSYQISSFEGMGKHMPLTSLAFTVGAFSLVGLPPFIGFPSKFLIVQAALAQENILFSVLVALILLGTVIEGAYFFRVVQVIYFKRGSTSSVKNEAKIGALIPMFIFIALIIVIGVNPNCIMGILDSAASELLNQIDYIRSVLG